MFIDYQASKIIHSVPIGVRLIFSLDHGPSPEELARKAKEGLLGDIENRFSSRLSRWQELKFNASRAKLNQ